MNQLSFNPRSSLPLMGPTRVTAQDIADAPPLGQTASRQYQATTNYRVSVTIETFEGDKISLNYNSATIKRNYLRPSGTKMSGLEESLTTHKELSVRIEGELSEQEKADIFAFKKEISAHIDTLAGINSKNSSTQERVDLTKYQSLSKYAVDLDSSSSTSWDAEMVTGIAHPVQSPMTSEAVQVTISKKALAQASTLSLTSEQVNSTKDTLIVGERQIFDAPTVPIVSRDDALNLFASIINIDSDHKAPLYNLAYDASINHSNLFTAVAAADEWAGDMLDLITKMANDERDAFLTVAAKGGADSAAGLVKIASLFGGTALHEDFLNTAMQLEDDELLDFINAAAHNLEDLTGLVNMTKELDDIDRHNFLTAAADSPNLNLLISHSNGLGQQQLTDFLTAAAKAGQALEKLVTLTIRLSPVEIQRDILPQVSSLSQAEFENYLTAAVNVSEEVPSLNVLINDLDKDQRESFLQVAARAGESTKNLIRQVASFSTNSTKLGNYLSAATQIEKVADLISVVQQAGHKQSALLSLAGDLRAADLHNFLSAAKEMQTTTLDNFIDQGNKLSAKERSHFFYGADKVGRNPDEYMVLVNNLTGLERSNLLLVIANSTEEKARSLVNLVSNIGNDAQRATVLTDANLNIILTENKNQQSKYIYLSDFLDDEQFSDFLSAASFSTNEDETNRLLDESDTVRDKAAFWAAAAGAKGELHHLLDLTEKLQGASEERFIAVAGKLEGENLQNFLVTASSSGDELDDFVELSGKLTSLERDNFLKASVAAVEQSEHGKNVLRELIDLTNLLSGPTRSLFLTVAGEAGEYLGDLLQATNNFISSQQNSVLAEAEKAGFNLWEMFEHKTEYTFTLTEKSRQNITPFIEAAKQTGFDPEQIFSHNENGYHFKNRENPEYVFQFVNAMESNGIHLQKEYYNVEAEYSKELRGMESGGLFSFLENAAASGPLLGSYLKPYI